MKRIIFDCTMWLFVKLGICEKISITSICGFERDVNEITGYTRHKL